jgi:photosystem II stability/assembly factor-like uncharacterized protein
VWTDLRAVSFVDSKHGWVAGQWGVVLHTEDGGRKRRRQDSGANYSLYDICFLNRDVGWAVGSNGHGDSVLIHTRDGEFGWRPQPARCSNTLFAICFANQLSGCAVGGFGTIILYR